MLVRIDPRSSTPLHAQIASSIRRAIASGKTRPGARLPAARDLAGALEVNMHTVLRAYRDLADEGLIELRRGRGARVVEGAVAKAGVGELSDRLVEEAKRLGVTKARVVRMVTERW